MRTQTSPSPVRDVATLDRRTGEDAPEGIQPNVLETALRLQKMGYPYIVALRAANRSDGAIVR